MCHKDVSHSDLESSTGTINGVVFYMTPSFSVTPFDFILFLFFLIPMASRYDSVDLSLSLASVTYDSTKFVVFGTRNHHERHATMR